MNAFQACIHKLVNKRLFKVTASDLISQIQFTHACQIKHFAFKSEHI